MTQLIASQLIRASRESRVLIHLLVNFLDLRRLLGLPEDMKSFLLTLAVLVFLSQVIPGNLDLFRIGVGSGEWVLVRALQGLGGWVGRQAAMCVTAHLGRGKSPQTLG